jgi:hypothetical protein
MKELNTEVFTLMKLLFMLVYKQILKIFRKTLK